MIPIWKTEERGKKSQKMGKYGSKWLKIVQFYPLTSPETPLYEFSRGYSTGTKTH